MNFEAFCKEAGLLPRDIVADGKWRRCPTCSKPRKHNGSYKLAADGRIGWCMDYAVHTEPQTWRPDAGQAPQVDRAAIARRRSEERKALALATREAAEFYAGCAPLRHGHPYLTDHGLDMTGCFGLKIDRDAWLVVPMLLDGNLVSVQRISPHGDKLFWPGASAKGASYTVERKGAPITVLCEGLATGLAIFAAAPLVRVVVGVNAGDLGAVKKPRGLAVVASDYDHETEARTGINPGFQAAQAAADALGCGVAVPVGIQGTDWADWRQERVADRLAHLGKRERESDIRRAIDAKIATEMSRNAKFLTTKA